MPIFEDYFCHKCKKTFEYAKYFGEPFPENPKCPICGQDDTKRKITLGNIIVPDYMKSLQHKE
jgi:putative FmdB family regulatory protein